MKRVFSIILILSLLGALAACGSKTVTPDYADAESFEAALNTGADLTGKTVRFTVKEVAPNSVFGYNLQTGEHLNFCSAKNPGVSAGDTITVEITEIESFLGSYIIRYKVIE